LSSALSSEILADLKMQVDKAIADSVGSDIYLIAISIAIFVVLAVTFLSRFVRRRHPCAAAAINPKPNTGINVSNIRNIFAARSSQSVFMRISLTGTVAEIFGTRIQLLHPV